MINAVQFFVYKWHLRFKSGRESVDDDFRSVLPAVVTWTIKDSVKNMVNMERRLNLCTWTED